MKDLNSSCVVAIDSIRKQSAQLLKLADKLESGSEFQKALSILSGTHRTGSRVVISGIGKSGHIGKKMAATLSSTGTSAIFVHSTEAFHGDLGVIRPDDVVILISNSGETDEVIKLLPILMDWGNSIISICGNENSTLVKHSHVNLSIAVDSEVCPNNLAPTSTTTATTVIGDALACGLMDFVDFKPMDFAKYHPGGTLGRKLLVKVYEVMKTEHHIAIVSHKDPIQEIALKITSKRVGCAFVMDEKKLLGVISDGDLRRGGVKEITDDKVPHHSLLASDIMTRKPVIIDGDKSVLAASEMMKSCKVKMLVVKQGDKYGCIEQNDVI